MRRDRQWKIVLYLDDSYGELYDLKADPQEKKNLWNDESLIKMRESLSTECLRWLANGSLSANRPVSRAGQQAMKT
jgi:arylsulfatase